ncbi:polysaccharide pyruvyl transferase family protein [Acinetobacter haemolyticus]|uniref:polysaccharide pyruvyl transferase family protein n=1 Tax=Acinetobacter haemolyticus TaxID=29430 RepID=UPI003EF3FAB4
MAKFLINNTALRNNGDVALVQSLSNALVRNGHQVMIATSYDNFAQQINVAEGVCPEVAGYKIRYFQHRLLANIAAIFLLLTDKHYRSCDVILGAPGGYINSFYGINWKLTIYRWAKVFGKKTAIYSQSVGPLNAQDKSILQASQRYIDLLVVRDVYSYKAAVDTGFLSENILLTEDAIFLENPVFSTESKSSKIVLFSVRQWTYEARDLNAYITLMCQLVQLVLAKGFRIEFVSTCQGLATYINDAQLAQTIVDNILKENPAADVCVDNTYHTLASLKSKISKSNLVIGTRLHMCLLALTSGIPAFNLSYEVKGQECYKYLGLTAYSIDYNELPTQAIQQLTHFLDNAEEIRVALPSIMQERHQVANDQLVTFLNRLGL